MSRFYVIEAWGDNEPLHREQLAQMIAASPSHQVERAWIQSTNPCPDDFLVNEVARLLATRVKEIRNT